MSEYDFVPVELYLWTLKCKFHIIFTSQNIILLLIFFQIV